MTSVTASFPLLPESGLRWIPYELSCSNPLSTRLYSGRLNCKRLVSVYVATGLGRLFPGRVAHTAGLRRGGTGGRESVCGQSRSYSRLFSPSSEAPAPDRLNALPVQNPQRFIGRCEIRRYQTGFLGEAIPRHFRGLHLRAAAPASSNWSRICSSTNAKSGKGEECPL